MNYKGLSFGLGVFSIALGMVEIIANRDIARALDQDDDTTRKTLKAFGAREIAAGANLLVAPAHSTNRWNRVAGDALDMAALGFATTQTGTDAAATVNGLPVTSSGNVIEGAINGVSLSFKPAAASAT